MILEKKTLLVSGVGTGLGRELARLALRDGARVVLAARSEETLAATAEELDPSGERIAWQRCDVTDAAACEALAGFAVKRFGALHALAQVAAYENVFGGLADGDLEQWRRAFETNVLGSAQVLRAAAPRLAAAGGGAVVLIGSQAMWLPQLPQAGYAASKGALLSAMYYWAKELGGQGTRVNMVVPSWMWGPPVEAYLEMRAKAESRPLAEVRDEITARIPLGHIVPDEDVAEAVLWLASDRARGITGQALPVNGGELMR